MLDVIRGDFAHATAQYTGMLERNSTATGNPRTIANNRVSLVGPTDWTSGFFPGALWLIYEYTGEAKWRDAAIRCTALVEAAKTRTNTHDVGFILNCSFGQGYRLTGNAAYRDVLLTGSASLSTRFNPAVGCIKSWDGRVEWRFPVIIDNMMNLELLEWAAVAGAEPRYATMAESHADKTLVNHYRADASCYHVVGYNPDTGAVEVKQTSQGAFDESAWARGQAWGLYGFTMMYRQTHRAEYLAHANRIAVFLMNHPRMPADKIPYWDFDAPGIPNVPRDASAAAIMSSALLELSDFVDPALRQSYVAFAEQQLRSLSSSTYRAPVGDNGGFLLMHSTGNFPSNGEIDVPLIYADYYYLEALLRYKARFAPAAGLAPTFASQPVSHTVAEGSTVVFTATAAGSPTPTFAWRIDGQPIADATSSTLVVTASAARAGRYTCTATNAAGSATSEPAMLTIGSAMESGRLINLSARAVAGSGAQTLIVGFCVDGAAGRDAPLLVRGMGSSLAAFGVTGTLADPALTVFRSGVATGIANNDNWEGSPQLAALCDQVGAFPFASPGSLEAALACGLSAGNYTAHVTGAGKSGVALAEIYDAASAAGRGPATPRLINVSVRAQTGTGANALFVGFVVGGNTSRTVLVRGLGPVLSGFGVTGVLADPQLRVYRDGALLAENDNWAGDPRAISAAGAVGAFALTDAASKDAVVLLTLPPGGYSAQVSGFNNTTSVALLEVYEVP